MLENQIVAIVDATIYSLGVSRYFSLLVLAYCMILKTQIEKSYKKSDLNLSKRNNFA